MSDEFDFEPRFGKIGHRKSARPKPFVRQVLDVAYKSGFKTRRKSSFTGRPSVRPASFSGPLQSLLPPTPLSGFICEKGGQ
jgi:hypothetical protein